MSKKQISFKQFVTIEPTDELIKELTMYEGKLPLYLKVLINTSEYYGNLKKINRFKQVQEESLKNRDMFKNLSKKEKKEYNKNQLMKWIKENPKFHKLLIDSIPQKE